MKELRIASQGSLLAMSGSHKLTVFTRGDILALRVQVGRLLPNQLQHLVSRIISNLKKGESARLPGLGKFTPGPRWSFQFEPKERKPAPRRGKR